MAVEYLRSNPEMLQECFLLKHHYKGRDDYLDKQSENEWCDELMLRAISAVLGRSIYILNDGKFETYLHGFEKINCDNGGDYLRIGHVRENHYVSLRLIDRPSTSDEQCVIDSVRSIDPGASREIEQQKVGAESKEDFGMDTEKKDYPTVWNFDQWLSWKKKNPWLICKLGQLGCSVCGEVQLQVNATQGMHIAEKWKNNEILAENGRKLKEKIYKHKNSEAHKQAEVILEARKKDTFKALIVDCQTRQFSETIRMFRTAYCVAKQNLAFTVHEKLVELQILNGLSMGNVHRSDHSCAKIIRHIARGMKTNFCRKLVSNNSKMSIMLDEATIFGKTVVVLYLRTCLAENFEKLSDDCCVVNVFLSLLEATDGATAKAILELVSSELNTNKLSDDWLKNSLVGVCTDGASVMSGNAGGFAKLLTDKYGSQIEFFHCMAHRLELSISDALKSVTATNHFQAFISSLHALYSQSPKNQRELALAAAETETVLLQIKGIFTVRWVASSFRSVRAIWRDFPALVNHFDRAASDSSRTTSERAKFAGLKRKLASISFVLDLALMKDVLREVCSLSLRLQTRNVTVNEALSAKDTTVKVLQAIKLHDGESTKKVNACLNIVESEACTPVFKGIQLNGKKEISSGINKHQFLQAMIDSITRRFPDSSRQIVKDLSVLDCAQWPDDDSRLLYGDDAVHRLCKKFSLPVRKVMDQFRDLKDGKKAGTDYNHLLAIKSTFPASSAECERG